MASLGVEDETYIDAEALIGFAWLGNSHVDYTISSPLVALTRL